MQPQSKGRRWIYILVLLSVLLPVVFKISITPVRLRTADRFFATVEAADPGLALVFLDFGPSTRAENEAQAEAVIEHLLRRKFTVAIATQTPQGEVFVESIPKRVITKLKEQKVAVPFAYGEAWSNLGYRPGLSLFLQALAKSDDIPKFLARDARGTNITDLAMFETVKDLRDVKLVVSITGLVGIFDSFVQFLQKSSYIPPLLHGCTSITIPEAYIYLDSGQLKGLLEGLSGAAWYSYRLKERFPDRAPDTALLSNTALGFSQLMVLFLIFAGNVGMWIDRWRS